MLNTTNLQNALSDSMTTTITTWKNLIINARKLIINEDWLNCFATKANTKEGECTFLISYQISRKLLEIRNLRTKWCIENNENTWPPRSGYDYRHDITIIIKKYDLKFRFLLYKSGRIRRTLIEYRCKVIYKDGLTENIIR